MCVLVTTCIRTLLDFARAWWPWTDPNHQTYVLILLQSSRIERSVFIFWKKCILNGDCTSSVILFLPLPALICCCCDPYACRVVHSLCVCSSFYRFFLRGHPASVPTLRPRGTHTCSVVRDHIIQRKCRKEIWHAAANMPTGRESGIRIMRYDTRVLNKNISRTSAVSSTIFFGSILIFVAAQEILDY